MRRYTVGVVVMALAASAVIASAEVEHEHSHHEHGVAAEGLSQTSESTLSGEVVDVFCYLSHGKEGLGKDHASCAKKCIQNGLPVAIKVGDQLYLATMANHEPANNALVQFAGEQVTVHGKLMEQDGQHLIAITSVEKAE